MVKVSHSSHCQQENLADHFLFFIGIIDSLLPCHPSLPLPPQAVAVLKGDSSVTGVITFTQEAEGSPVTVSGDVSCSTPGENGDKLTDQIKNLDANAERGFHVQ